MWIVAVLGVVGVLLWQSNQRRAKRFIRAVCFLDMVDKKVSADEANGKVARLFTIHSTPQYDDTATAFAIGMARQFTEGKQLPWINEAREKGFVVDGGNTRFDMAHNAQPKRGTSEQENSPNFEEQFSARVSSALSDPQLPHTPTQDLLRTLNLYGLSIEQDDLVRRLKRLIRLLFNWALRGAGAGFLCGFVVPNLGPWGGLEPWAVPLLFAYLGAMVGIVVGACYRAVRWVYTE